MFWSIFLLVIIDYLANDGLMGRNHKESMRKSFIMQRPIAENSHKLRSMQPGPHPLCLVGVGWEVERWGGGGGGYQG